MKNDMKKPTQKSAKRDNEELWEYCKEEAVSKMGKFSARAMQFAVKLYKERGGGYIGEKTDENSLVKWTKEDWGYTGEPGHSRYLPKKAREHLTVGEKIATDRAKNKGTKAGKQWVAQPERIAKKTAKYRLK
ncbi:MAG: hypothetical protein QG580_308 [Patescibacteria group bacterium]|jgi:hypothetical protein|nr:hypothetical protein [Patescibacteria group bacterium]